MPLDVIRARHSVTVLGLAQVGIWLIVCGVHRERYFHNPRRN